MSDTRLFGIVTPTLFQGLTMTLGDIYRTKEEAEEEYADLRRMRSEAIAAGDIEDEDEDDDGYDVVEIIVKSDGTVMDSFDDPITVSDANDREDVLKAVSDLLQGDQAPRESM